MVRRKTEQFFLQVMWRSAHFNSLGVFHNCYPGRNLLRGDVVSLVRLYRPAIDTHKHTHTTQHK